MKLSLIASALAAAVGSTIAIPGPIYAHSLERVDLFERDVDSVDLFTRNPADPGHHWQLPNHWHAQMPHPHPNHAHPQPQGLQQPNPESLSAEEELSHAQKLAGQSLRKAQAAAECAAKVIPQQSRYYKALAVTHGRDADRHFLLQKDLVSGRRCSEAEKKTLMQSAVNGENNGQAHYDNILKAMERKQPGIAKEFEVTQGYHHQPTSPQPPDLQHHHQPVLQELLQIAEKHTYLKNPEVIRSLARNLGLQHQPPGQQNHPEQQDHSGHHY